MSIYIVFYAIDSAFSAAQEYIHQMAVKQRQVAASRVEAERRAAAERAEAGRRAVAELAQCIAEKRCHSSGVEFIKIPTGSFKMGSKESSDEQPIHTVNVPAFLMSKTEVTVGQYRRCVEAGRCTPADQCSWGSPNWTSRPSDKEDYPINCVDWGQARTFAKWVGADVDLPTEAEWEYAARGGQRFKYAGSNNADEVAWYTSNTNDTGTRAVGTKKANGFGLHDMSGNVWEWTLDEYESSYSGASSDGSQARGGVPICRIKCDTGSARRVLRGGGWSFGAGDLRVSIRGFNLPDYRRVSLGFRLRKTLKTKEKSHTQGTSSQEIHSETMSVYISHVSHLISRRLRLPNTISHQERKKLSASIYIKIGSNHKVKGKPQWRKHSGNRLFDQAVIDAVMAFSENGPDKLLLPKEIKEKKAVLRQGLKLTFWGE